MVNLQFKSDEFLDAIIFSADDEAIKNQICRDKLSGVSKTQSVSQKAAIFIVSS